MEICFQRSKWLVPKMHVTLSFISSNTWIGSWLLLLMSQHFTVPSILPLKHTVESSFKVRQFTTPACPLWKIYRWSMSAGSKHLLPSSFKVNLHQYICIYWSLKGTLLRRKCFNKSFVSPENLHLLFLSFRLILISQCHYGAIPLRFSFRHLLN